MTLSQIKKALLEDFDAPKEIRTNDGRIYIVAGVERWSIGNGTLLVVEEGHPSWEYIQIRNIASIGRIRRRRRKKP